MNREQQLRVRIKWLTWLFILGLVVSGVTAIPLQREIELICSWLNVPRDAISCEYSVVDGWLDSVRRATGEAENRFPFLFYGTDWLAFGHFAIAIAFVGALRDPVRNRWLFDFGLIACGLVIPYAIVFGELRAIPFWWRLIDCAFGVVGFVPLWFCRRWARELEANAPAR